LVELNHLTVPVAIFRTSVSVGHKEEPLRPVGSEGSG